MEVGVVCTGGLMLDGWEEISIVGCEDMRVAENLVLLYTELGVLGGLSELIFLLERSEAL